MRSTLVFKNIRDEHHETWEETCKTLLHFIISEPNVPYSFDDIDLLSWAHRGAENQEDLEEEIRNGRVTEEIRNKIMMLNVKKQTKVVVNQMYSKYLTICS